MFLGQDTVCPLNPSHHVKVTTSPPGRSATSEDNRLSEGHNYVDDDDGDIPWDSMTPDEFMTFRKKIILGKSTYCIEEIIQKTPVLRHGGLSTVARLVVGVDGLQYT